MCKRERESAYRRRGEDAQAAERLGLKALHAPVEGGRARRARERVGQLLLRRERHVQRELRAHREGRRRVSVWPKAWNGTLLTPQEKEEMYKDFYAMRTGVGFCVG